jgi:hypothetical protein
VNNRNVILNLLAMAGFALSPMAQAVVPPPDGGYPGFNTAEGQNALFSRTTGVWNTALGAFTLFGDTTGNGNTAVGINALRHNIIGGLNTAVGLNALLPMTRPEVVSPPRTRPLEAMRFFPILTAGATLPLVQTPCSRTQQPTETRPSAITRCI